MGEVEHDHIWWLYYLCEDADGTHKVFDNLFYPVPTNVIYVGYQCMCGAVPSGAAP